jgi:DNA polymerase III epsilon subunit-like protein
MVKRIAFIYTDTTGLHKKMEYETVDAKNLHTWARLVGLYYQIGYRDSKTKKIVIENKKKFIIIPEDFRIPIESTALHLIDNKKANKKGTELVDVLDELKTDLRNVDVVVSHNIIFHLRTIQAECLRKKIYIDFSRHHLIDTIDFYHNLEFPKLEELYCQLTKKSKDSIKKARSYKVTLVKKCLEELYNKHEKNVLSKKKSK